MLRDVIPRKVENYVTKTGLDLFQAWFESLSDRRTKILIDKAIAKVRLGNLGDHKSIGEGVQEIRLDYGPGYRLYFAEHGQTLIILFCGGTKKRQQDMINKAKMYWQDWKERVLK